MRFIQPEIRISTVQTHLFDALVAEGIVSFIQANYSAQICQCTCSNPVSYSNQQPDLVSAVVTSGECRGECSGCVGAVVTSAVFWRRMCCVPAEASEAAQPELSGAHASNTAGFAAGSAGAVYPTVAWPSTGGIICVRLLRRVGSVDTAFGFVFGGLMRLRAWLGVLLTPCKAQAQATGSESAAVSAVRVVGCS